MPPSTPIALLAGLVVIAGAWFLTPAEVPSAPSEPAAQADRIQGGSMVGPSSFRRDSADWDFWAVLVSVGVIAGLVLAVRLAPRHKRATDASRVAKIFE